MIHKNRIQTLTEEEIELLLFCLNEHKSGPNEINVDDLHFIRDKFIFISLNESAKNLAPEKISKLQVISDKLIKFEEIVVEV